MASMNIVYLSGNLTRDPELRYVGTGTPLATFAIGVTRRYEHGGETKQETSFVDIKCWGALAERAGEELSKGCQVAMQGRLEQERWQAADGSARSKIVVVADRVDVVAQPKPRTTDR